MSADRFKWLEFGEPDPTRGSQAGVPRPGREFDTGKDENWHLAEAGRAFADGEYEPALRNYSAALKYKPDHPEAWAGQARCMVLLGQLPQALTWGQKGLEKLPTSAAVASALAYVMARAGHPGEGLDLTDQILSRGADVSRAPWFWLDRGVCLLESGQLESANSCLEKALALSDGDPDWLQRIGVEYTLSREPARALTLFNKALEQRAGRVYLWLLTARAASGLNLAARAAEALDQALRLDPTNREASAEKGRLNTATRSRPCWIASMVFQGDDHPVVIVLRAWRDEVWMRTAGGRIAAGIYHLTAPLLCLVLTWCVWLHGPLRTALYALARRLRLFEAERTATMERVAAMEARVRMKGRR